MRRNEFATPAAEALTQREDDHQRWADDGGPSPDPASAPRTRPPVPPPVPRGLPVRLVYRRRSAT